MDTLNVIASLMEELLWKSDRTLFYLMNTRHSREAIKAIVTDEWRVRDEDLHRSIPD